MEQQHSPERPSWDCAKCGQPWPCANAKTDLLQEYVGNHTALLVYLAFLYWEAFEDQAAYGSIPADLRDRFLQWVKQEGGCDGR